MIQPEARTPGDRAYEDLVALLDSWQGTRALVLVEVEGAELANAAGYLAEVSQSEPGSYAFGITDGIGRSAHTTFHGRDHETFSWGRAEVNEPLSVQFQLSVDGATIDFTVCRSARP
jgi:hypothetical protein